jgi:hypothetical protein
MLPEFHHSSCCGPTTTLGRRRSLQALLARSTWPVELLLTSMLLVDFWPFTGKENPSQVAPVCCGAVRLAKAVYLIANPLCGGCGCGPPRDQTNEDRGRPALRHYDPRAEDNALADEQSGHTDHLPTPWLPSGQGNKGNKGTERQKALWPWYLGCSLGRPACSLVPSASVLVSAAAALLAHVERLASGCPSPSPSSFW